jgi:hypothetical protein
MTPRFLREEAARFRAMAGDTERHESKLRLLAMAEDYEARAVAGDAEAAANPVPEAPEEPETQPTPPINSRVGTKRTLRLK